MKGLEQLSLWNNKFSAVDGGRALAEGMKGNTSLTSVVIAFKEIDDGILYHLKLNRGGRRLLHTSLLASLWPLVLKKAESNPDVFYHLLREDILLTIL
jgi:hypothetical protein